VSGSLTPRGAACALRSSEWIFIVFFAYITALIPFFRDRPGLGIQPVLVLALVIGLLFSLAQAEQRTRFSLTFSMIRDWVPMGLTLLAFREMELFVPTTYNTHYENAWIRWDEIALNEWGLKRAIEFLGPVIPTYLELCYLLVYGLGTFCVVVIWMKTQRRGIDRFYVVLSAGTLLSYALFPYFPSRPPRLVFPEVGFPVAHSVFRTVNLFLLRNGSIHTGVFPSAHVSSAISAAWALFLVLPRKHRGIAWGVLLYAISVAIATIYGRYHYAVDAVAGFGISLVAGTIALVIRRRSAVPNISLVSEETGKPATG
jgi:membrane-associated phospholipid phosphatase